MANSTLANGFYTSTALPSAGSVTPGTIVATSDLGVLTSNGSAWIPLYSTFTASNTQKLRAAIARIRAGSGTAKLLFMGDSTVSGSQSSGGSTSLRAKSFPVLLGAILSGRGVASQDDSIWGNANYGVTANYTVYNPRLVAGSSWTCSPTVNQLTMGGFGWLSTTTTNALVFTPTTAFDTIDVFFLSGPGRGTFTVNVDGGATLLTQNSGTGGDTVSKTTITGVTLATHAINIQNSGVTNVQITGIAVRASTVPRIEIYNAGISGARLENLLGQGSINSQAIIGGGAAAYPILALPVIAPDVTFIDCTINNINAIPTTVVAYQANLVTLVTTALASGDVVLMTGNPGDPATNAHYGDGTQTQFNTAVANVAAQFNLPFIDIYSRWGSFASSNSLGYNYTDGIHPIGAGYADIAAAVGELIR